MAKDRDHLKNVTDTKGTLHAKMGTIKERKYMDLTEADMLRSGDKNTQKSCTKKILMTQITMTLWPLTHSQTSFSMKSCGP